MPTTILTDIPDTITAGDSVAWALTFSTYPASAGWILSYALTNDGNQITFAGTADGNAHLIDLATTDTVDWPAGDYAFQAYVTLGAERFQISSGLVTILPNLAAATEGLDALPYCFKVRDALIAVLEMRATESQTSIAVGGRQISEMTHEEIQSALARAEAGCNNYIRRNRRDRGKNPGTKIKTAFRDI